MLSSVNNEISSQRGQQAEHTLKKIRESFVQTKAMLMSSLELPVCCNLALKSTVNQDGADLAFAVSNTNYF